MNPLVVLGVAAFALGVAAMVAPSLLPVPVDRAFVSLLGLAALVQAYGVVVNRLRSSRHRTETGDPEVLAASSVPGEAGTEAFEGAFGGRWFARRSELREAAVTVLARYGGLAESAARARVAEGSWTDDPVAAAHLGEDAPPAPVASRLRRLARRESAFEFGRRRTVEAIADLAGVESTSDPSIGDRDGYRVDGRGGGEPERQDRVDGEEPRGRPTGHWRGVGAVALVAVGVGVLTEAAPVVLAGVVGVGFAAYAHAASPPAVDLQVERALSTERAAPGDVVEVSLAVTNAGERALPDLRLVDGVPGSLAVDAGSPRLGTALRPGETATVDYEVVARRGVHEFDQVTVLAGDLAGATESHRRIQVRSSLVCVPPLQPTTSPAPIRHRATKYAGQVQTPAGGEGVEFHATRTYQPGDPTGRIDWNRRARTGELATLEFREERAATVVVAVDAREPAYVAHEPHGPHAVDRAVDAAGRLLATLLDEGNRVGLAGLGTDTWLAPGSGSGHRARARELLATDPGLSSTPGRRSGSRRWKRRLERRLPPDAQLVVLTPLCDPGSSRLVRTLEAVGHPASVVSPDPTAAGGTGPLLATVAREVRITDLRRAGVPVVDWSPAESLDAALERAARRRSP